jgi:hypothetical protein
MHGLRHLYVRDGAVPYRPAGQGIYGTGDGRLKMGRLRLCTGHTGINVFGALSARFSDHLDTHLHPDFTESETFQKTHGSEPSVMVLIRTRSSHPCHLLQLRLIQLPPLPPQPLPSLTTGSCPLTCQAALLRLFTQPTLAPLAPLPLMET